MKPGALCENALKSSTFGELLMSFSTLGPRPSNKASSNFTMSPVRTHLSIKVACIRVPGGEMGLTGLFCNHI